MNKVLLIGNSGTKKSDFGGQTTKVRLYLKKMIDENISFTFVDLENYKKNPLKIFLSIKKEFNNCNKIVLITAKRGAKLLIPFINFLNKKTKKEFVFPLVGTSVLHYSLDKLSEIEQLDFLSNRNFDLIKPKKNLIKQLKKITYILPETDQLTEIFRNYYKLDNVYTLTNFRDINQFSGFKAKIASPIKLVFLSRVMTNKGIFDLIDVIKRINDGGTKYKLDIYGELDLNDNELSLFKKLIADYDFFSYKGIVQNDKVVPILHEYDLFVFPTRFPGEGTPGAISEALIAGVPVLSSNFPQVSELLSVGEDSIVFNMYDLDSFYRVLLEIYQNQTLLIKLSLKARENGKKYTYGANRDKFLKYVC